MTNPSKETRICEMHQIQNCIDCFGPIASSKEPICAVCDRAFSDHVSVISHDFVHQKTEVRPSNPHIRSTSFVDRLVGEWRSISAKYEQLGKAATTENECLRYAHMYAMLDHCARDLEEDLRKRRAVETQPVSSKAKLDLDSIRARHAAVEGSNDKIEKAQEMAYLSHLDRADLLAEIENLRPAAESWESYVAAEERKAGMRQDETSEKPVAWRLLDSKRHKPPQYFYSEQPWPAEHNAEPLYARPAAEPCETTALHASAPHGSRCADCSIDGEACPACYEIWWCTRHASMSSKTREEVESRALALWQSGVRLTNLPEEPSGLPPSLRDPVKNLERGRELLAAMPCWCPSCGQPHGVNQTPVTDAALAAEKTPVNVGDPCPAFDATTHQEHQGQCMYCGAPMSPENGDGVV